MENLTVIEKRKASIKEGLIKALEQARFDGVLPQGPLPEFTVETPRESGRGDFAANIAMLLARDAKMPPRAVAAALTERLDLESASLASCEVAGPGFINCSLKEGWLALCLKEITEQGASFGKSGKGRGQKVQVEFVSANPTGELHMGNARGAALGDTLASLLSMAGYEVQREFYVNDAGNQIERFAASLEARYLEILGQETVFPEDGYHGEDITRTMRRLYEEVGDKYANMDPSLRREFLTTYALEKKITSIRETLAAFGVEYDVWFSEQSLHDSGAIVKTLEKLRQGGWLYEKEGAVWLACTRFGEEKDEVLIRANGIPTYFAADIAYHDNKFRRGFDKVINIWGADHHGHVARMKGAMQCLGYDRERLEVILMQLVRLMSGGEILRMSKRTGTYVTLAELMEEVGVDAARFFFVMRSADSQMDFDMDLARKQSADNPVFYVQYAHARICSILTAAEKEGFSLPAEEDADFGLLRHESELALIRKLADFPDEIVYAAKNREPHRIAVYLLELATAFHNFYTNCRVLDGDDKALSAARLLLVKSVAGVLATGLGAMGVSAPKKM
ncbi:MAG: arginine--tRNA ligase [Clostridiales bacterium]|nr:arginine--tRNA ligase [Clostridiales bacterium]